MLSKSELSKQVNVWAIKKTHKITKTMVWCKTQPLTLQTCLIGYKVQNYFKTLYLTVTTKFDRVYIVGFMFLGFLSGLFSDLPFSSANNGYCWACNVIWLPSTTSVIPHYYCPLLKTLVVVHNITCIQSIMFLLVTAMKELSLNETPTTKPHRKQPRIETTKSLKTTGHLHTT